jgi:glycine oxidase
LNIAVIGGGVIGLSLSWELAQRGHVVTLVDRQQFGREASWAGAGILLPGNASTAIHPLEHLEAASNDLHAMWAQKLLRDTGIDNGYRKCGGLYVATTPGEVATLAGSIGYWQEREIEATTISRDELSKRHPELSKVCESQVFSAAWMPGEAQICNPWHLNALVAACQKESVSLKPNVSEFEIVADSETISSIRVDGETVACDVCVFACGAWTQQVTAPLVDCVQMIPVRGQMVLYRLDEPLDLPIVNEGTRYVVSRSDGHVLVGATIEEAGFDPSTTEEGIAKLADDASRLVPKLTNDKIVKTWAGLRPGTHDGFPYMGSLPGFNNAFVSTGHFKIGLQLSTGSAVAMADAIEGKPTLVDLAPFDPSRVIL